MRLTPIILIGATLALTQIAPGAEAQRQGRVAQPQAQITNSGEFRARPAPERLATARRLLGPSITISDAYLNSPFSLTPRQTYVSGRGWLIAHDAGLLDPRAGLIGAGDEGQLIFAASAYSNAEIHLEDAAGKRFLFDCGVWGPALIRARTLTASTQANNATYGALLSIVTAPGEDVVTISGHAIGAGDSWRFRGCEITRIQ